MVLELSAVRVLAPSFGDSVPVWTNVIGVILFGLAVGAALGGYLADRGFGRKGLAILLFCASALVFLLPLIVPRLARWIMPEAFPLDRALPVLIEGSLAVASLSFLPPVLLLGSISPLLIRIASDGTPSRVGRISGSVYAFGTLGSLIGTFLSTYYLWPVLGRGPTFLIAGASLILAGCLALLSARKRVLASFGASLTALTLLVPEPPPVWLAKDGSEKILEAVDSPYQRLWIVEGKEGKAPAQARLLTLKINEGLDSFHSVWIEGSHWTGGRYYDSFALLPYLYDQREAKPGSSAVRVLSLGAAGGSILRVLGAVLGERLDAVAVELDPMVWELAKRYFRVDETAGKVHWIGNLGARVYVKYVDRKLGTFDLICLVTYRSQFYLPAHLTSHQFFEELRERLSKDGILAINIGDVSTDGEVLSAVAGTLASVLPTVESFHMAGQRYFLLFAHNLETGRMQRSLASAKMPAGFPTKIWQQARHNGSCRTWDALPDDERLSDERSRLGRLHERVYARLPATRKGS